MPIRAPRYDILCRLVEQKIKENRLLCVFGIETILFLSLPQVLVGQPTGPCMLIYRLY